MKSTAREHFRWAPHVSGSTVVKRKDYEQQGEIEAGSEYAAWMELKNSGRPLGVGDLLETEGGELRICKYVGFEPAQWFVPAPEPAGEAGGAPDSMHFPIQK